MRVRMAPCETAPACMLFAPSSRHRLGRRAPRAPSRRRTTRRWRARDSDLRPRPPPTDACDAVSSAWVREGGVGKGDQGTGCEECECPFHTLPQSWCRCGASRSPRPRSDPRVTWAHARPRGARASRCTTSAAQSQVPLCSAPSSPRGPAVTDERVGKGEAVSRSPFKTNTNTLAQNPSLSSPAPLPRSFPPLLHAFGQFVSAPPLRRRGVFLAIVVSLVSHFVAVPRRVLCVRVAGAWESRPGLFARE